MSFDDSAAAVADALLPEKAGGLVTGIAARTNAWTVIFTLIVTAVIYDQVMYIWRKGSIAGQNFKIPFIGPFMDSVDPKFEEYVEKWNSGDLSCVSVFHKFVVIASTRDMARKVFNAPTYVKPCVVDVAQKLLRPTNWVFLDGQAHVAYRKGLNALFTRHALDIYLPRQEEVYNDYFKRFVEESQIEHKGQPTPFMPRFRELMCAVSCRTFAGYYIPDDAIKKIADDYYMITASLELVNFPFILPFSKTWYGKKAADMVLAEFAKAAAKAKVRMRAGGETTCILDAWVKNMLASERYTERKAKGIADESEKPAMMIKMFTDWEISQTLLTFLFASQDATSSACTWLFQLMADRPELLDRVREENLKVRNGNQDVPLSMDLLEQMTFTRAVVKETLRYRPPVIMVPYLAKRKFQITPDYAIPKGSMVVPTTYPALHDPEAYPNPDSFDPDRWITGTAEQQGKNWLVFGTGPHYCIGQTYAQMNLAAMVGLASMKLNWKHQVTEDSEKIRIFATIFPKDHCLLTFSNRTS